MDMITLATSVIPDRSLGFTLTVIVAGLGIVLATLALLILVFKAFGTVMDKSQQAAKKKQLAKQQEAMREEMNNTSFAPIQKAPAVQPVVQDGISGEIIAAISAAVYAMEGSNAVIRSVTRKKSPVSSRNPWAQAAINDNTRPF